MSGECPKCGEHALECSCETNGINGHENSQLDIAMAALNIALQNLLSLGFELKNNIEFVKRNHTNERVSHSSTVYPDSFSDRGIDF